MNISGLRSAVEGANSTLERAEDELTNDKLGEIEASERAVELHGGAREKVGSVFDSVEVKELNNEYPNPVSEVNLSTVYELTPAEKKIWASYRIETLETDYPPKQKAQYEAVTLLNESISSHREGDLTRVKSVKGFNKSRDALREVDGYIVDNDTVRHSTFAVLIANRGTAEAAIEDAERVLRGARDDANNDTFESAEALLNGSRAVLNAGDAEANNSSASVITARARAVEEYKLAWQRAQRAIDSVRNDTKPGIEITSGSGEYGLEEGYIEYPLRAVIKDVRPYKIDTVTVNVNGEPYGEFEPSSPNLPDGSAFLSTTLELEKRTTK